ncbi:MAG TPA: adenylosuccinate synthase, partial [Candidatus Latescibacteria bacterium]|nr:adenylosuccinate synthase [Candidatus Latescibacterota bacterium]
TGVIGNGVVLDPAALVEEMDRLEAIGVRVEGRLFVSRDAHLVMPYHKLMDRVMEQQRGKGKIGTTGKGIGPCYRDKAGRIGIRVGDLLEPEMFRAKLRAALEVHNRLLAAYGTPPLDEGEVFSKYLAFSGKIAPLIADISLLLNRALDEGQRVLFEGAQGTLLDIDHGTYPFVTSSNTTAGGACTGTGVGPTRIDEVVGVAKAYTTRVGEGPLPTEFEPELEECLRRRWREYGATTGRGRRCGWFDAVAVRYAARVNGFTSLALTRLDSLEGLDPLRICVAYVYNGRRIEEFPGSAELLRGCQPEYEELPGWKESISSARSWEDLPEAARRYVQRIEELVGVEVGLISVGREREQTVVRKDPW